MGGRGSSSKSAYEAGAVTIGFGDGNGDGKSENINIAGWTPQAGSRFVDKDVTINSANDRIKNLDHEQMVIVGRDGYVLSAVDGSKHSVSITPEASKHIRGNDVFAQSSKRNGIISGRCYFVRFVWREIN